MKNGNERVLRVLLAQPRGFCAGVERAIEIVQRALDLFGPPVYVRHEIVHNKHVVESLRAKGAVFVENLSDIPEGAVTIFSAHGVPEAVQAEAERRKLPTIDATCPLVSKVHKEGQNHALKGREVILIGHEGHPEVEGTRGRIPGGVHLVSSAADVAAIHVRNPEQVAYVTQTTLSVDDAARVVNALRHRFPNIVGPKKDDICYATQNRQDAVKALAPQCDVVIVVGSPTSSNSNRLREVAANLGVPAYMVDNASEIQAEWIAGKAHVGLTAGASAPEVLVREVSDRLQELGIAAVENLDGAQEKVSFALPRGLG